MSTLNHSVTVSSMYGAILSKVSQSLHHLQGLFLSTVPSPSPIHMQGVQITSVPRSPYINMDGLLLSTVPELLFINMQECCTYPQCWQRLTATRVCHVSPTSFTSSGSNAVLNGLRRLRERGVRGVHGVRGLQRMRGEFWNESASLIKRKEKTSKQINWLIFFHLSFQFNFQSFYWCSFQGNERDQNYTVISLLAKYGKRTMIEVSTIQSDSHSTQVPTNPGRSVQIHRFPINTIHHTLTGIDSVVLSLSKMVDQSSLGVIVRREPPYCDTSHMASISSVWADWGLIACLNTSAWNKHMCTRSCLHRTVQI